MAGIIEADEDTVNAMVFGVPTSEDRQFLRSHLDQMSNTLAMSASNFVERARQAFDTYDLHSIDRKISALGRKTLHLFDKDIIQPIKSIGGFQQAGFSVQRWLMANPRARNLFAQDRIHGYRDTYIDIYPGKAGDAHPDYQKVVNGLVEIDEEGNNKFVEFWNAYDDEGREELDFAQQRCIRDHLWNEFEYIFSRGGDDPSDPDNSSL